MLGTLSAIVAKSSDALALTPGYSAKPGIDISLIYPIISSVNVSSHTSGGTLDRDSICALPPYTAAVNSATSFIRATSFFLSFALLVRSVPSKTAVSGIIFAAAPP